MDEHIVLTLALFFASAVVAYAMVRLWQVEQSCNHHWEFQRYIDHEGGKRLYQCIRCGEQDVD